VDVERQKLKENARNPPKEPAGVDVVMEEGVPESSGSAV
jgi:hypothetical protein